MSATEDHGDGFVDECALLPAWFTYRMMQDSWHFGLLTVTNHLFYVQRITAIRRDAAGDIWLDVDLWPDRNEFLAGKVPNATFMAAPTSRTNATLNARHIVAAVELADT